MKRTLRGITLMLAGLASALTAYGQADLQITGANYSTDPVVPGEAAPVSITLTNLGDATSAGDTLTLEVLRDDNGDGIPETVVETLSDSVAAVEAEAETTVEFVVQLVDEDEYPNGYYDFRLTLDSGPTTTYANALQVEAYANLQASEVRILTTNPAPGGEVLVEFALSNAGNRSTRSPENPDGDFAVTLSLKVPTPGVAPAPVTFLVDPGNGLEAGADTVFSEPIWVPLENYNGTYEVRIELDTAADVAEADGEGDNRETVTFGVDTKPDLQVTRLSYETSSNWEAGDLVHFEMDLQNNPMAGGLRSHAVYADERGQYEIAVVLSSDDIYGNDDDFLLYQRRLAGNGRGGPLLGNNASALSDSREPAQASDQVVRLAWEQAMPRNFFGDYFVLAKVDLYEEIDEYQENNINDNGNNIWYARETARISIVPSENPQPTTYRASIKSDGTEGAGLSEKPAISEDGRYVAFSSLSQLVEEDTDNYFDIYRRDNVTGEVVLVSKSLSAGISGNGDSRNPSISADGRFVAYASEAENLAGTANGYADIFRTDMESGATVLISLDSTNGPANAASELPSISADGTMVVYQSLATDLVGSPSAGILRVYAQSVTTAGSLSGDAVLLSAAAADSYEPEVSDDGAFAVFTTEADGTRQVYRAATDGSALIRISETAGVAGNGASFNPSVSADGDRVAFATFADNLDGPASGTHAEIVVVDVAAGSVTRLVTATGDNFGAHAPDTFTELSWNADSSGSGGPAVTFDPSGLAGTVASGARIPLTATIVDGDLEQVWFELDGVPLVDGASGNISQVGNDYTYDFLPSIDRQHYVFSVHAMDTAGNVSSVGWALYLMVAPDAVDPDLSADGSRIVFRTLSNNLLPQNGLVRSDGATTNLGDEFAVGYSDANATYGGFLNGILLSAPAVSDVYLYDFDADAYQVVSVNKFGYQGTLQNLIGEEETLPNLPSSRDAVISGNGRYVAFSSDGRNNLGFDHERSNQLSPDLNEVRDVFIHDLRIGGDPVSADPLGIALNITPSPLVQGQPARIEIEPDDATRRLESVHLIVNGAPVQTFAKGSYTYLWTPGESGVFSIYAIVIDEDGNIYTSDTTDVAVGNADAPIVEMNSPSDGAEVVAGQSVNLIANAYYADAGHEGNIVSMEFFVDGASVGVDASAPYSLSWTPTATGAFQLVAMATDNAGNRGYSDPRTINVINASAPSAVLLLPDVTDADNNGVADNTLVRGNELSFAVRASDVDGRVASVDFYVNGTFVGSGSEVEEYGVYEVNYTPPVTGTFTLLAVVTDDDGFTREVSLDYTVVAGGSPVVAFLSPDTDGASVALRKPLELRAEVTDPEDDITSVRFFFNGIPVAVTEEQTGDVFTGTYTPTQEGPAIWAVQVVDLEGNDITASLDLVVSEGSAPVVEILSPPEGGRYLPGTELDILASAYDEDGIVEEVQFRLNGQLIAAVAAPFQTRISLPAVPDGTSGAFTLSAIAIDDQGNASPADAVNFEIGELDIGTPRIVMSHPLPMGNGDTINDTSVAGETWLNAEVYDPDNPTLKDVTVLFYVNGQRIATVDTPVGDSKTYAALLDFNAVGTYSLYARAIDADGHIGQAIPIILSVRELQAPMPEIEVLPVHDDRPVEQPIPLYAETDGGLVGISRVDFFANGVLLKSVVDPLVTNGTKSIYTIDWTPETALRAGVADASQAVPVEITARAIQIDPNGLAVDNWRVSEPTEVDLIGKLFDQPTAQIDLISPLNGATYDLGTQVPLIADVSTSGAGSALQVDFYANGQIIGSVTQAPFRVYWRPSVVGDYALSAVLQEIGNGVLASAAPIAVEITEGTSGPEFSYVGPARYGDDTKGPGNYPNVTAGSDVQLVADVGDADGFIEEVRFFVNGNEVGVDQSKPFSVFWTPQSAILYQLEAEAIDNAGKLRLYSQDFVALADRQLTVAEPEGQVPSVSVSVTADGNISPGSRLMVAANVFDDDPDGVDVTFFLNGVQLGETDTEGPFFRIVEPVVGVPPHEYSLTVLASDADGNSRAKILTPLYISDLTIDQPTVTMITPSSGDTLSEGSRTTLLAEVGGAAAINVNEVHFYANGVLVGRDGELPYSVDWIPSESGDYEVTVAVLLNSSSFWLSQSSNPIPVTPVTVANPVHVTVNPPTGDRPSVSFQVLPEVTQLAQGSQVILYADAQDYNGGWVRSVEFRVPGEDSATTTVTRTSSTDTTPFSYLWTVQQPGDFLLSAVARDNEGNVVESNFIGVEVSPTVVPKTPEIDLTVPTGAARSGDFITLRSSVRDFVNGPDGVVFYIDGQPVGTATEKPYNFVWEANLERTVSVFATARHTLADEAGSVVSASSVAKTILLGADENPAVSFVTSWPGSGAGKPSPLLNELLTFTVTATDNGRVETIELLRDGETVQTVSAVGTTTIIDNLPPGLGVYDYSVVATDNAGRQTVSAVQTIQVVVGALPTVEITSPEAFTEFLPNEAIVLRASASDSDGTVVNVQFYVDDVPLGGPDTTAPYTTTFNPGTAKRFRIGAQALDNSGNYSTLDEIQIDVLVDDSPVFDAFAVNVGDGNGSSADPYIVRVGQGFSITTEASDTLGLTSVRLFRNSVAVTPPAGATVPTGFTDTLASPGIYAYRAEATDSGDNVTTAGPLYVRAITGSKPIAWIESPLDEALVEVGMDLPIRVNAQPADESVGPDGTIARVEIRANGTQLAVLTSPPYTAGFNPPSEGEWEISVVATSDTGVNSEVDAITLFAVDQDLPEITSFTNDTMGNQTRFGIPITFKVTATAEGGIGRVEFYRSGYDVDNDGKDDPLGEAVSEPYTFVYTPYPLDGGTLDDDRIGAGIHLYYARVFNNGDYASDSDPVEINIRYPDPLGQLSATTVGQMIQDYVFQTHLDLLLRVPSETEQNAAVSAFNAQERPLDQNAAITRVLDLLDSEEYIAVRSALIAQYLFAGEWPERHTLESDVRLVNLKAGGTFEGLRNSERAKAVQALVQILLPALEASGRFGKPVPSRSAPYAQIDEFLQFMWMEKYGAPINQLVDVRDLYIVLGRENFLARFILDVDNIVLPGESISPILGFENPPNDRMLEWSNAAAMYLSLLRRSPSEAEVEDLAAELPATQVSYALNSGDYAARFRVADLELTHVDANWRESSWFGEFWADPSGWNYHLELGWVFFDMEGQSPSSFWYYDHGTGWSWTSEIVEPYTWSAEMERWLYRLHTNYNKAGQRRWFYDYEDEVWANY